MTARNDVDPLALAGLRPGDEDLYRTLLRNPGITKEQVAELKTIPLATVEQAIGRFLDSGLVNVSGELVTAAPPAEVLSPLAQSRAAHLLSEFDQVDALRDLIPDLVVEQLSSHSGSRGDVDVEVVSGGDVYATIRRLIDGSTGDVLWWRPDQWRLERSEQADELLPLLLESGRRSRAVYPAVALEEAHDVIRRRAEHGELIRIAATVPMRMVVFGQASALVPDRWGENTGRRLVVREHSLVGALTALFEATWDRAIAVPGLETAAESDDGDRRLLLHQLTRGAKDEQIARALGVSLRTVRRRVAAIMEDLGADSRFQAGVEAVRRGWI